MVIFSTMPISPIRHLWGSFPLYNRLPPQLIFHAATRLSHSNCQPVSTYLLARLNFLHNIPQMGGLQPSPSRYKVDTYRQYTLNSMSSELRVQTLLEYDHRTVTLVCNTCVFPCSRFTTPSTFTLCAKSIFFNCPAISSCRMDNHVYSLSCNIF